MRLLRSNNRGFLGGYLGRWGKILLPGLVALILWPIWIFWDDIRFDPVRFTEEWIKLTATGIVAALVVHALIENRLRADRRHQTWGLIDSLIATPVSELLQTLDRLEEGKPIDILDLESHYKNLRYGINSTTSTLSAFSAENQHILTTLTTFDQERCSNLIRAVVRVPGDEVDRIELQELYERLRSLQDRLLR